MLVLTGVVTRSSISPKSSQVQGQNVAPGKAVYTEKDVVALMNFVRGTGPKPPGMTAKTKVPNDSGAGVGKLEKYIKNHNISTI